MRLAPVPSLLAALVFAAPLVACGGTSSAPLRTTSCTAALTVAYTVPDSDAQAGSESLVLAVSGDTAFYSPDGASIVALPPSGAPTTVVASGAVGYIGSYWVDAGSLVVVSDQGVFTVPVVGGTPTNVAPQATLTTMPGTTYAYDGSAVYSAASTLEGATSTSQPYTILKQPMSGGPTQTLATATLTIPLSEYLPLFDVGGALWLQASTGEIVAIDKSSGATTQVVAALSGAQYFAPASATKILGTSRSDGSLTSFAVPSGAATSLWPSDAPTFDPKALAIDADGTAYVAGFAYDAPTEQRVAFGKVPATGQGVLTGCVASGSVPPNPAPITVAVGQTTVYALVLGQFAAQVLRFQK